jgi:hypothetical protein
MAMPENSRRGPRRSVRFDRFRRRYVRAIVAQLTQDALAADDASCDLKPGPGCPSVLDRTIITKYPIQRERCDATKWPVHCILFIGYHTKPRAAMSWQRDQRHDMSSNSQGVPTLVIPDADPRLYNHDLAPAAPEGRTWGVFSLVAMWMSDVHSVGGYTFAASLFFLGLTGWQVLISMLVGILAVYFLMNLIGRPSLRYGIPYPVVARISFGVMGANLAACVRGVVGIVWYGVQTYFASKAVQVLVVTLAPATTDLTHNNILGLSTLAWFSFGE